MSGYTGGRGTPHREELQDTPKLTEEALEGKHLQAPSSNRTLDEAKKQVVSFLQWLDNWAVNVIPTYM